MLCLIVLILLACTSKSAVLNYGYNSYIPQKQTYSNPFAIAQQPIQLYQQPQQALQNWGLTNQLTTQPNYVAVPQNSYTQYTSGMNGGQFDIAGASTAHIPNAQTDQLYQTLPQNSQVAAPESESVVSPTSSYYDPSSSIFNNMYGSVVGTPSDGVLGMNGGILGSSDDAAVVDSAGDSQFYINPAYSQAFQPTLDPNQMASGTFQITPEAAEQHKQQDERLRQLLIKHFTTSPFHRSISPSSIPFWSNIFGSLPAQQTQQPQQQVNQPQTQQYSLPLSSYLSL